MTKINPFTNRPQADPSTDEELNSLREWDVSLNQTDQIEALTDNHYSTAFAIINTILTFKHLPTTEKDEKRDQLREALSRVNTQKIPDISLWISELIQNALDSTWGDDVGASKVELDFSENSFTFRHDGRPPQYVGYNKNEIQSMIQSGSTKKADLSKEGRFGIGFKYWTYYFRKVTLSSSGWDISWDKDQNIYEPVRTGDEKQGLTLKFTDPITKHGDREFTPYTVLAAQPSTIISGGMIRLVKGLALQPTPMNVVVRSNQDEIFKFSHEIEPHSFDSTSLGTPINYLMISNSITLSENGEQTIPVPMRLVGVDVAQLYEHLSSIDSADELSFDEVRGAQKDIATAITQEFADHDLPSVKPILQRHGEEAGVEWNSEESKAHAAEKETLKIKSMCLFDLSDGPTSHFLLNSLFPISHRWHNNRIVAASKNNDRVYFVGSYHTNEDRTSLSDRDLRNFGILHAQFVSFNLLMSLVAESDFRDVAQISSSTHRELLLSDSWTKDIVFASCVNEENESINLQNFTSFSAWPVVARGQEMVSQQYVPLGKVVRLRQHFDKLLSSEEASVKSWVQGIIEPDESCVYFTRMEGENQIPVWTPCYPHLASFTEEQFRPLLMNSEVPNASLAGNIQKTINDNRVEWPAWLPIPLSEIADESRKSWHTLDECRNYIILGGESNEVDEQEWPDEFTSSVHDKSVEEGMKSYTLVDGFSLPPNRKIDDLKVEDPGRGRLFQLSIEHLREEFEGFEEYIKNLLVEKAQNHTYWPAFCYSSEKHLLMIHQPTNHWRQTFICMNDSFSGHDKSLWSQKGGDFIPILDALQTEVQPREAGQYIENISDPSSKKYTHLVFDKNGGDWCNAFSNLKQWTPVQADQVPVFSECEYHYVDSSNISRNKPMAFVNVQAPVWPEDTSSEFKERVEAEIPPVPNILRAIHLPIDFKKDLVNQVPRPFRNRRSFADMYKMNLPNSAGFFRHIFNLVHRVDNPSQQRNNNSSDSHIERTPTERSMFENINDPASLAVHWKAALSDFAGPMCRNYAFMFHILSPATYAMERLIQQNESNQKLKSALILSAFEGLHSDRFEMPAGNRSFSPFFCAITRGEGNQQRLVIDKAKLGQLSQAQGNLAQIGKLSDNIFDEYKSEYVGFNSEVDEQVEFFDVPLYGSDVRFQENVYLPSVWSVSVADGTRKEGLVARMLLNATKDQNYFPFRELSYSNHYRHGGNERTNAVQKLRECLPRDYLDDDGDGLVFRWLFHPRGKAIDALVKEIVSEATKEGNTIILTIVESLFYWMQDVYPEDAELLRLKLRQWFSFCLPAWESVLSAEFYRDINEARANAHKETLLQGLRGCTSYQEGFDKVKEHPNRVLRYTPSASNWRRQNMTETNLVSSQSNLIMTEMGSIFGTVDSNETFNTGTGFGLLRTHFWCPLRREEISIFDNIPGDFNAHHDWEYVINGFEEVLKKAFESQSEAINSATFEEMGEVGEKDVDEQYSFLQDVVDWMYLHAPGLQEKLTSTGEQVMNFRPHVRVEYSEPTTALGLGNGMSGVVLGPAGWSVSFADHTLTFSTSKPRSKDNFSKKFDMLYGILSRVVPLLCGSTVDVRSIDINRIRNEFNVGNRSITRINPLKDFDDWHQHYSRDLIEPDQGFIQFFNGDDWRQRDGAEHLFSALEVNINTWLEQQYATKTEWKSELVKMYGNGMTCTLLDFRQPHLADQMASDMDRMMKVIRLHSGRGNKPTGVLDENQARTNNIGSKFMHIGNSLLVSPRGEHVGNRLNGWRLVAPPGHEGESFLSYLENHWQDIAYNDEVLDLDTIVLDEVVKQPDDDAIHDRRGSIILHKLHMLYILAYYRATAWVAEEEE